MMPPQPMIPRRIVAGWFGGEPVDGPECRSGREQGRGLRGPLDEHAPRRFRIHPTLRAGRRSAREVRTDDRTIHTRGTDRLATPVQRLFNRSGVLNDTGRWRARQRCRSGVDGQPADLGHCRRLGEVVPQGVVDGFLATVEACHVGGLRPPGGWTSERPGRSSSRSSGTPTDRTRAFGTRITTTFARPKDDLLPVVDQAFSALILDLEQRGLLDETLVLVISEHGRTPLIDRKARGEAATTGRVPIPRSMPAAAWVEATESVDSSTRLRLAFHFEFGLGVQRQRPPVSARKPMASWWQINWASSRWSGVCKNGCPFRLAVENVCEGDSTSTESEPQCRFRAESRLNTEGRSRAGSASTEASSLAWRPAAVSFVITLR